MQNVTEDRRSLWRRSSSLAEFEQTMSSLLRPCQAQEKRGARYRTEVLHERVGGLGMTAVSIGGAARIKVDPDRTLSLLQIPIAGTFVSHHARHESERYADGADAQLVDAESPLELDFQDATRMLIVDLTPAQAEAVGGLGPVRASGGQRRVSLGTPEGARLLRLARFMLAEIEAGPLSAAAEDLGQGLEQTLIAAIGGALDAARGAEAAPRSAEAGPAPEALRRAERFMREHLTEALDPARIAEAAGLSTRSLHRLFRRHRGVTPLAAFKEMRLERVHAEILAGRCPEGGLTGLAMDWGFNHAGLFAADYRRKFGHPPSETLRARASGFSCGQLF